MDYSGIINLVLVTIIYSTFIAPNLKKMSDIRSDISDLDFVKKPRIEHTEDSPSWKKYDENIRANTETLKKKLSQYALLFGETKLFLKIFYWTLAVVFAVQIALMYLTGKLTIESGTYMGLAVVVVILLALSLHIFMVPPRKIRTIRWMYAVGIAEVHACDMYSPVLRIGHQSANMRNDTNTITVELASRILFVGNNIVFTVESLDGTSMFAAVAGKLSRYANGGTSDYRSGDRLHLVELITKLKLKPGEYKARLIVFGAVYGGFNYPIEATLEFQVTENEVIGKDEPVDLSASYSPNITYTANEDARITTIDFSNGLKDSDRLKELLANKNFLHYLKKARVLSQISDTDGLLSSAVFTDKYRTANWRVKWFEWRFFKKFKKPSKKCRNIRL